MTKTELFIKLAEPNENGISRWVMTSEFVDNYKELHWGMEVAGVEQIRV